MAPKAPGVRFVNSSAFFSPRIKAFPRKCKHHFPLNPKMGRFQSQIAAREAGNVSLDSCVPIMMEGGEEIRWGNSKPLSVIKYFR